MIIEISILFMVKFESGQRNLKKKKLVDYYDMVKTTKFSVEKVWHIIEVIINNDCFRESLMHPFFIKNQLLWRFGIQLFFMNKRELTSNNKFNFPTSLECHNAFVYNNFKLDVKTCNFSDQK